MIDILIPLVAGLLLIFSPQIFIKSTSSNFEKNKATMKTIGVILVAIAVIYYLLSLTA